MAAITMALSRQDITCDAHDPYVVHSPTATSEGQLPPSARCPQRAQVSEHGCLMWEWTSKGVSAGGTTGGTGAV